MTKHRHILYVVRSNTLVKIPTGDAEMLSCSAQKQFFFSLSSLFHNFCILIIIEQFVWTMSRLHAKSYAQCITMYNYSNKINSKLKKTLKTHFLWEQKQFGTFLSFAFDAIYQYLSKSTIFFFSVRFCFFLAFNFSTHNQQFYYAPFHYLEKKGNTGKKGKKNSRTKKYPPTTIERSHCYRHVNRIPMFLFCIGTFFSLFGCLVVFSFSMQ